MYVHDTLSKARENGHFVNLFVSEVELRSEWPKYSSIPFDSLDKRGQHIDRTIIRYLTSKGLTKDSAGLSKLSAHDVSKIEKGIANHTYRFSFLSRLHQLFWEYESYSITQNPSGHSATMRFEFWKTAILIIKDHPLTGVGTGDVPDAFTEKYEQTQSKLSEKWRLRAHNQFLTFAVAFGIIGLTLILLCMFYPLRYNENRSFLYLSFFIIAAISMLTEDTIETQAGVTFFAFFTSYLLFQRPADKTVHRI
jgi:hypothetical protein